ncbi:MAG: hypothetical protein E6J65_05060 [Deltaproteobacteria bacterium]|nr:MAG: hypothetical protein E6J65_05060 [Deltaproteobacteria bacterium]
MAVLPAHVTSCPRSLRKGLPAGQPCPPTVRREIYRGWVPRARIRSQRTRIYCLGTVLPLAPLASTDRAARRVAARAGGRQHAAGEATATGSKRSISWGRRSSVGRRTSPRPPAASCARLSDTFALLLEYDGAAFRGWQKQPGMATGLRLPPALRLRRWEKADPSFHARGSSVGKRYRYDFRRFVPTAPDWNRARAALLAIDGLPHLSGLSSPSKDRKPAPPLTSWELTDDGMLEVSARAFRRHEVRNLAGHLAAVALGLAMPESLRELALRTRPWMGARAPAHGLTLVEVLYAPELDPFR